MFTTGDNRAGHIQDDWIRIIKNADVYFPEWDLKFLTEVEQKRECGVELTKDELTRLNKLKRKAQKAAS